MFVGGEEGECVDDVSGCGSGGVDVVGIVSVWVW